MARCDALIIFGGICSVLIFIGLMYFIYQKALVDLGIKSPNYETNNRDPTSIAEEFGNTHDEEEFIDYLQKNQNEKSTSTSTSTSIQFNVEIQKEIVTSSEHANDQPNSSINRTQDHDYPIKDELQELHAIPIVKSESLNEVINSPLKKVIALFISSFLMAWIIYIGYEIQCKKKIPFLQENCNTDYYAFAENNNDEYDCNYPICNESTRDI